MRRRDEAEERILEELREELEAHLQMRTEELVARGMEPEEARREAERRFGDVEAARRANAAVAARRARRMRRSAALDAPRRWTVAALRRARHAPGPTVLTASIFALAVGLTASTLTFTDHVLSRPLPFPDADRLFALYGMDEQGNPISRVSMGNWVDWKEGAGSLESTALYQPQDVTVLTGGEAFWADGAWIMGPFFETLGISVQAGRPLTERDGLERAPVAAISGRFWREAFGEEQDLASLDLTVSGRRVEVVGVVAEEREFPGGTDVWLPAPYRAETGATRNNINYAAVARLEPGVPVERAQNELDAIARGIRETDPEAIYSWGVPVRPLHDVVVGESRGWLELLLGAVLAVLLVACANLAGLGLAEARRRERDVAVRLALGASRRQVFGEQMAERLLPALAGGALGIALAWVGTSSLLRLFADHLPRTHEIAFDGRIAALAMLACAGAGVVSGLIPAARATRGIARGLGGEGRGGVRGGRGLPGAVMVGAEVAIAVALLVGGGLLVRSLTSVMSRDLGYEPEGVALLEIALTAPEYQDPGARLAYWDRLLDQLRGHPGVQSASLGNWVPTGGGGTSFIELEGVGDADVGAGYRVVGEDYFRAMGISVLSGRTFQDGDGLGTERVGLVNRSAAQRYWPGSDAVGQRIKAPSMEAYYNGGTADWIRVVGVVDDVRHSGFEAEPRPELFVLHRQVPGWTGFMTAVVKLREGTPAGLVEELARGAQGVDPRLAVRTSTLEGRLRSLLAERRLVLGVLGVFAGAALMLACLGIYGLVSFAVASRTREIAVRAALGAARGGILALVLGSALRVAVAGAAVGLGAALLLRRVLDFMVVGVGTADPVTYLGAALLMTAVAFLAALAPSLRATRLDPVEALRKE